MKDTSVTLYSGIRQALKDKVLFRGSLIAGIGILLWLLGGIFAPPSLLASWGPFLFLTGGALITLGLVPYRRLIHLESHPHQLKILPNNKLQFLHKGRALYSIPLNAIQHIAFQNDAIPYGIALWLKSNAQENAFISHRPNINAKYYIRHVQKHHGCDLFFPYFGSHAFQTVKDSLKVSAK